MILARLELTISYSASIRLIQLGHRTIFLFWKKNKILATTGFDPVIPWFHIYYYEPSAIPLRHIASTPHTTPEGFEPSSPKGNCLVGSPRNHLSIMSRSVHHLLHITIHMSLDLHHRSCMVHKGFEPLTLALLAPRSTT